MSFCTAWTEIQNARQKSRVVMTRPSTYGSGNCEQDSVRAYLHPYSPTTHTVFHTAFELHFSLNTDGFYRINKFPTQFIRLGESLPSAGLRAPVPNAHTRQQIRMKHPRKFDDPPDLKLFWKKWSALFRCALRSPRDVRTEKHRFHLNLQIILVESWPDSWSRNLNLAERTSRNTYERYVCYSLDSGAHPAYTCLHEIVFSLSPFLPRANWSLICAFNQNQKS